MIKQSFYLDAFSSAFQLKLVGPFDFLALKSKELNYLVHARFSSDLPEIQTIMVYNDGRFAYWR